MLPKERNSLWETLLFEHCQIFLDSQGRLLHIFTLTLDEFENLVIIFVDQPYYEFVWRNRLDLKRTEDGLGKVPDIERYDKRCVCLDRCGKDMAVIRVRQLQSIN